MLWCLAVGTALTTLWKCFCRAKAIHLGGTWYGSLSGFTCNENVPSKQPIPVNTSLKSLCSCCIISTLALMSLSWLDPGRRSFILLVLLSIAFDLSSFFYSEMVSVLTQHFQLCQLPALCLYSGVHALNPGGWLCLYYIYWLCQVPVYLLCWIYLYNVKHVDIRHAYVACSFSGTTEICQFFCLLLHFNCALHMPNWLFLFSNIFLIVCCYF